MHSGGALRQENPPVAKSTGGFRKKVQKVILPPSWRMRPGRADVILPKLVFALGG
jgi:hypothetical protein